MPSPDQQGSLTRSTRKKLSSNRRTMKKNREENDLQEDQVLLINEKAPEGKDMKIQNMQKEVGVVMDIMKQGIINIQDKGSKLETLERMSENLNNSSQTFQKSADALSEKHRRANRRMMWYIALIILILIIVIGSAVYFVFIH